MVLAGALVGQVPSALFLAALLLAGDVLASRVRAELRRRSMETTLDSGGGVGPFTFLPLAFSLQVQNSLIGLLALAALVAWAISQRRDVGQRFAPRRIGPAAAVLAATGLIYGRSFSDIHVLQTSAALGLALFLTVIGMRRWRQTEVLVQLTEGLAVYLLVSVVLYWAGVRSPAEGVRIGVESANGLFSERLLFPLSLNLVTPPAIAAAFLSSVPGLSLVSSRRRFLRTLGMGAAVYVLLAADYRSALVFGPLIGASLVLRPKLASRVIPAAAVLLFVMALWYPLVSAPFGTSVRFVEAQIPALERKEGSSSVLSNRETIWERSRDTLGRQTVPARLTGLGLSGHVKSGASASYASVLRGTLTPESARVASPHNSGLQYEFDSGLAGLGAMMFAIWTVLARLGRRFVGGEPSSLMGIGTLASFATVSATEVILAPSFQAQEPFMLLLVYAAILAFRGPRSSPSVDAPVRASDVLLGR